MIHTHETHEIELPCRECDAVVDVEILICAILAQDVNLHWNIPEGWALEDSGEEDEAALLCPLCAKHLLEPEAALATP